MVATHRCCGQWPLTEKYGGLGYGQRTQARIACHFYTRQSMGWSLCYDSHIVGFVGSDFFLGDFVAYMLALWVACFLLCAWLSLASYLGWCLPTPFIQVFLYSFVVVFIMANILFIYLPTTHYLCMQLLYYISFDLIFLFLFIYLFYFLLYNYYFLLTNVQRVSQKQSLRNFLLGVRMRISTPPQTTTLARYTLRRRCIRIRMLLSEGMNVLTS